MRTLLAHVISFLGTSWRPGTRHTPPTTLPRDESQAERDRLAAQFIVAEYNTMMAKVHLWMTFQYSGMSLVAVTLTLLARLEPTVKMEALLWSAAIVIVVAYIAYQGAMLEGLRAVLHVERELRPRAEALLRTKDVFRWEPNLRATRKPNPGQSRYIPAILSAVAGIALFAYRWPSANVFDYIGVVAVGTGTIMVAYLTWQGKALDAQITAAIRS
jgi:hypothetical protein